MSMKFGNHQEIAAHLATLRKKKMAQGGLVGDDMDQGAGSDLNENAERGLNELRIQAEDHPSAVENPEYQDAEHALARALFEKAESQEMRFAMGGLVQSEEDMPLGNKPDEEMSGEMGEPMPADPAATEEAPARPGLSAEAMAAIDAKRKKRRFM